MTTSPAGALARLTEKLSLKEKISYGLGDLGNGFYLAQPWVRNVRMVGANGSTSDVWDMGIQMKDVWIDK